MAQVWLVTGSSRGLGRAIVEAGLAAGNKVLATARDIESLHDLSERHGDQIKLFALDVTDESAAASAVKAAIGAFGSLEVVINNAGYGNLSSVEDTPMSDFRAQIETNLFGTIIVTKAALPYFRQRKAGHFVQMIVPKRFVSICARKSDIGVSSTDERLPYPALLITTSSAPKAPIAAFTALAAADSSVTSSAKSLIWSPWRSDRSCRDSMSLAVANTLLPAARPASTIARPRPRELPVTNQTCAIHPPIISNRFLRI